MKIPDEIIFVIKFVGAILLGFPFAVALILFLSWSLQQAYQFTDEAKADAICLEHKYPKVEYAHATRKWYCVNAYESISVESLNK